MSIGRKTREDAKVEIVDMRRTKGREDEVRFQKPLHMMRLEQLTNRLSSHIGSQSILGKSSPRDRNMHDFYRPAFDGMFSPHSQKSQRSNISNSYAQSTEMGKKRTLTPLRMTSQNHNGQRVGSALSFASECPPKQRVETPLRSQYLGKVTENARRTSQKDTSPPKVLFTPNKKKENFQQSIDQQFTEGSMQRRIKKEHNTSTSKILKASNIGAYLNGRDSTYIKQFANMMRKKYKRRKMVSDTLPGINAKRASMSTQQSSKMNRVSPLESRFKLPFRDISIQSKVATKSKLDALNSQIESYYLENQKQHHRTSEISREISPNFKAKLFQPSHQNTPATNNAIGLYNLILSRNGRHSSFLLGKTRLQIKAPSRFQCAERKAYAEYDESNVLQKLFKSNRNN